MTVDRLFVFLSVIGYALHTGGGWTRDMLIADREELEKYVASEVHVKRFKSQDVQVGQLLRKYSDLYAFDYFGKKIRVREETPTLKGTRNLPTMWKETHSEKILSTHRTQHYVREGRILERFSRLHLQASRGTLRPAVRAQ